MVWRVFYISERTMKLMMYVKLKSNPTQPAQKKVTQHQSRAGIPFIFKDFMQSEIKTCCQHSEDTTFIDHQECELLLYVFSDHLPIFHDFDCFDLQPIWILFSGRNICLEVLPYNQVFILTCIKKKMLYLHTTNISLSLLSLLKQKNLIDMNIHY